MTMDRPGIQTARAVIFDSEGQLLLIERHKDGKQYFVLPGGHVDGGETPEQAVVREVLEETSCNVMVRQLLYTSSDDIAHHDQRIYLCEYHGGEPALQPNSVEAQAQRSGVPQQWLPGWFRIEDLQDKQVFPQGLLKYLDADRALNFQHNPYKIIERQV